MPKTKVQTKKETTDEEKIIEPDLVVPAMIDEDALEETEEGDEDGLDLDILEDKFEE